MIAAAAFAALFAADVTTLPNGAKVAFVSIESAKSVSVQAFVRCGSVTDGGVSGLSHLLEHALFRRASSPDYLAEAAGGELGASTHREFMRFWFRGPSASLSAGIAAMGSLLREPTITDAELLTEKAILGQEVSMRRMSLREVYSNEAWSNAAEGTAYALPPMGDVDALRSVTKNHVVEHYRKQFHGGNLVIVVSGVLERTAKEKALEIANSFRKEPPTPLPALRLKRYDGGSFVAAAAPGFDKPRDYVAFAAMVDALSIRLLQMGHSFAIDFGISPSGSAAMFSPQDVVTQELAKLSDSEKRDAIARIRRTYERMNEPMEIAFLTGFGLLFGEEDFVGLLRKHSQLVTAADIDAAVKRVLP